MPNAARHTPSALPVDRNFFLQFLDPSRRCAHRIPGRIRVVFPELRGGTDSLARAVETFFQTIVPNATVTVNAWSGSVVVQHGPDVNQDDIAALLKHIAIDHIADPGPAASGIDGIPNTPVEYAALVFQIGIEESIAALAPPFLRIPVNFIIRLILPRMSPTLRY